MAYEALASAIRTRAQADNGAGGLFNVTTPLVTRFAEGQINPNQRTPYVFFTLLTAPDLSTFGTDVQECVVSFTIVTLVDDGGDIIDKIVTRLRARYHRQSLSVNGWSVTPGRRVGGGKSDSDEFYLRTEDYSFILTKT